MDEIYDRAVDLVKAEGKASCALLQRRLLIGYNRASRILERMEAEGLIGPIERPSGLHRHNNTQA